MLTLITNLMLAKLKYWESLNWVLASIELTLATLFICFKHSNNLVTKSATLHASSLMATCNSTVLSEDDDAPDPSLICTWAPSLLLVSIEDITWEAISLLVLGWERFCSCCLIFLLISVTSFLRASSVSMAVESTDALCFYIY